MNVRTVSRLPTDMYEEEALQTIDIPFIRAGNLLCSRTRSRQWSDLKSAGIIARLSAGCLANVASSCYGIITRSY